MLEAYGPQGWWPGETPFEIVVGAMLMPQTSWRNVERAIANLRGACMLDPHSIAKAPLSQLRTLVKPAGLYGSKPRRLRSLCQVLVRESDGNVDAFLSGDFKEARAKLLRLDGVGPETADSILLYASSRPVFVVDAYTTRIGTRVGLLRSKEYQKVQRYFERVLPKRTELFREYHALLVEHGKRFCKPKPDCTKCPMLDLCKYGKSKR